MQKASYQKLKFSMEINDFAMNGISDKIFSKLNKTEVD